MSDRFGAWNCVRLTCLHIADNVGTYAAYAIHCLPGLATLAILTWRRQVEKGDTLTLGLAAGGLSGIATGIVSHLFWHSNHPAEVLVWMPSIPSALVVIAAIFLLEWRPKSARLSAMA